MSPGTWEVTGSSPVYSISPQHISPGLGSSTLLSGTSTGCHTIPPVAVLSLPLLFFQLICNIQSYYFLNTDTHVGENLDFSATTYVGGENTGKLYLAYV
jgi:hypothetical protein